MLIFERAGVGLLDFFNHLGHPIRSEKRGSFAFFDFSNLFGDQRAAVQEH